VRTLGADRGVVAVARVHHRRIVIHVEDAAADIGEQLGEVAGLPRLADSAGEQAVVEDLEVSCTGAYADF
jgi:hypothetical protein